MKTCGDCQDWLQTDKDLKSYGKCTNAMVLIMLENGTEFHPRKGFSCKEFNPKIVECDNPSCGRLFRLKTTGKSHCSIPCGNSVRIARYRAKKKKAAQVKK